VPSEEIIKDRLELKEEGKEGKHMRKHDLQHDDESVDLCSFLFVFIFQLNHAAD